MDSIRGILYNVNGYVNFLMQKNDSNNEFASWLNEQLYNDDLLARYCLNLFQTKETNAENIRLGKMASTRMSRVLQMLSETSKNFEIFYQKLRNLPTLTVQIDEINKQILELERFFYQTEISFACLEKAQRQAALSSQTKVNE